MAILVTGSLAIDHIMVFRDRFRNHILPEKIHAINVAFHIPTLRKSFGGTAGNIAINLRGLGDRPILLATVGSDFGEYAAWLDRNDVPRDQVLQLADALTAQAFITTDLDDNQIIAFHAGAMDRAHEATVSSVPVPFSIGIVAPNGKRAMQEHARALKARRVTTVIDPGQGLPLFDGAELTELLDGADLYIVNDYEWALTLDRTGRSEAEIIGRVGSVVVTRGEKGSTLLEGERQTQIPAVPAGRVVDPTGCGDAYRAGLLHGMLRGLPLETCTRIGSLLGSMMVECEGTQSLRIDPDAFRARYVREFGTAY